MDRYPELVTLEMGLTMAVAMLGWTRFRGHGWAATLEMSGAMLVPAIAAVPLIALAAWQPQPPPGPPVRNLRRPAMPDAMILRLSFGPGELTDADDAWSAYGQAAWDNPGSTGPGPSTSPDEFCALVRSTGQTGPEE
jgi:hypothetical protein